MRVKELFAFIKERHYIYELAQCGEQKPWTKDKILQSYRFCNVYRELDTQTKWLMKNWGSAHSNDADYWFACVVFRLTNWHETAEAIGYPIPWDKENFSDILRFRKGWGYKVYSGAYTISTNGVAQEKYLYLAEQITKIWNGRDQIRYKKGELLQTFFMRLQTYNTMGSFLAAQVVADMKFFGDARKAADWWTFVAPGPGSKRGLNRVYDRPKDQPWRGDTWRECLKELHYTIDARVEKAGMPRLSAQDLQNCLCEFDKYERVRLGEGRPRSTYKGV